MPSFEVTLNGKTYDVDAPNAQAAAYAAGEASKGASAASAKPYKVTDEIGSAWNALKSDVATAYGPHTANDDAPDKTRQAPRNALTAAAQFVSSGPMTAAAAKGDGQRVSAADRLGGDVISLATSPFRGALSKYVNKPIAAATGIPEAKIGEWETVAGIALGATPLGASGRLSSVPKPTNALARNVEKAAPKAAPVPKPKPLGLPEVTAAKKAAYDAVEQSGVAYTPEAFRALADDVVTETKKAKINPMRHPKAASMVAEMEDMAKAGHAPSLTELDQLRQVVRRDVANSRDDSEAFFGNKIIDRIDDFIENAPPTAVSAGSAKDAAGTIKTARSLHQRQRKMEAVTDAVERATLRAGSTNSGGNIDNAIRQNLRTVLEKGRGFTPDERAALESIVLGDKGQNVLRQVGRLSPAGNGLTSNIQMLTLIPTGGLSALAGVAGAGAKVAADSITKRKVAKLLELIGEGGALPAKPVGKSALSQPSKPIPKQSSPSRSSSLGQDRTKGGGR